MKNILYFTLILALVLTSVSCDDETPQPNPVNVPSLWDMANSYQGDWNGYINIQNRRLFGNDLQTESNAQHTAIAKFWDDNESTISMNSIMVGDVNLEERTDMGNTTYTTSSLGRQPTKHLFGTTVNVSVTDDNGQNGQVDVYCPEELVINEPIRSVTSLTKIGGTDRNVLITWNADYNNDKGVGIAISFSPKLGLNRNLYLQGHTSPISSRILVEDDGEYTLSIDNRIPDGAVVTVYMIRGDVQQLPVSDKNYLSNCYTLAYSMFSVRPISNR